MIRRTVKCLLLYAMAAYENKSYGVLSFVPQAKTTTSSRPLAFVSSTTTTSTTTTTTTSLHMVFDFFKQRAEEGVEQLSKLTQSASEGRLGEALADAAAYTRDTNEKFADGLAKSRNKLLYDLDNALNNDGVDFLEDLEDVLLQADLGVSTTEDIMAEVRSLRENNSETFFTQADLKSVLRSQLLEALEGSSNSSNGSDATTTTVDRRIRFSTRPDQPTVLFLMGANGMGKTTTVGKLAHRLVGEGKQKVMVAACDTFRAGAVDQLRTWTERSNSTLFEPARQGDSSGGSTGRGGGGSTGSNSKADSPAAVLYGALDLTLTQNYDTLLVDTSGRLSNNDALTQELIKMKRVVQKRLGSSDGSDDEQSLDTTILPHETLLVVDAAQGRMALDSARQWHQEVGLTGLVLTKLDGSARGGSVVAVSRELGIPVKLVGVGEGLEDLRDFEPETFVDSLLGIGTAGGTKGASSNEGKELEQRLEKMRRARDERAKETKPNTNAQQSQTQEVTPTLMQEYDDDDSGVTPITAGATTAATAGRTASGKNTKNKKKKKKKKNKR